MLKYPLNTLKIHKKIPKNTIALHFTELLPKKTAKFGPQTEFTIKHRMFSLKVYPSAENFARPTDQHFASLVQRTLPVIAFKLNLVVIHHIS